MKARPWSCLQWAVCDTHIFLHPHIAAGDWIPCPAHCRIWIHLSRCSIVRNMSTPERDFCSSIIGALIAPPAEFFTLLGRDQGASANPSSFLRFAACLYKNLQSFRSLKFVIQMLGNKRVVSKGSWFWKLHCIFLRSRKEFAALRSVLKSTYWFFRNKLENHFISLLDSWLAGVGSCKSNRLAFRWPLTNATSIKKGHVSHLEKVLFVSIPMLIFLTCFEKKIGVCRRLFLMRCAFWTCDLVVMAKDKMHVVFGGCWSWAGGFLPAGNQ